VAIAEGYIPASSHGLEPQMTSHETACVLKPNDQEAHIAITVFFADRGPAGPYRVTVPARRTRHIRFNQLNDPGPIPKDTDYASVLESDSPGRGPAHASGFAPGRARPVEHGRLRGRRLTASPYAPHATGPAIQLRLDAAQAEPVEDQRRASISEGLEAVAK
jgi:hypothetical protein